MFRCSVVCVAVQIVEGLGTRGLVMVDQRTAQLLAILHDIGNNVFVTVGFVIFFMFLGLFLMCVCAALPSPARIGCTA